MTESTTDRTTLREQIAEAVGSLQGTVHHLPPATRQAVIDAVLAVLPEPADRTAEIRAALLRELADKATEWDGHITVQELRRMAAEPAAAGPDQTRPSCPDPIECGHEAALGEAQAAVERVRALANGEYYGITGRAFLAALDGPRPDADASAVGGAQQRAATVDPAVCPRCKGDNSEAFELCERCAPAVGGAQQPTEA